MILPPPSHLIGHPRFSSWYPGQDKAAAQIISWLGSDKRFLCAPIPTGLGKSLLGTIAAVLYGRRTVTLTVTKGLQDQMMRDFSYLGLVDIKGQNSYQCIQNPLISVDVGMCHTGRECDLKSRCLYYSHLADAKSSSLVVTNYAYWLAQNEYGGGLKLGDVEDHKLLIMDEAHLARKALESHLTTTMTYSELDYIDDHIDDHIDDYIDGDASSWDDCTSWDKWKALAKVGTKRVLEAIDLLNDTHHSGLGYLYEHKKLRTLLHKLSLMLELDDSWIKQKSESGITFSPVWVNSQSWRLFRNIPKVILMSAVLSPKTVEQLGIPVEDQSWLDVPSPFEPKNTPIRHLSSVRVDRNTTPEMYRMWVRRIDRIIEDRLDKKGIVFTVSYDRAKTLLQHSEYKGIMIVHGSKDLLSKVGEFKKAAPPKILVSPAVTTGWDFPADECEYIVVGKIPYPDTRGEVSKARMKSDHDWAAFEAMETLVQETGRGTRNANDKCEVFVVDDNWNWWWKKYKHFAPDWFIKRVVQ